MTTKLPFYTKSLQDGRYRTLTSKIWSLPEAKEVAEDQSRFLNREVFICDDDDKEVLKYVTIEGRCISVKI